MRVYGTKAMTYGKPGYSRTRVPSVIQQVVTAPEKIPLTEREDQNTLNAIDLNKKPELHNVEGPLGQRLDRPVKKVEVPEMQVTDPDAITPTKDALGFEQIVDTQEAIVEEQPDAPMEENSTVLNDEVSIEEPVVQEVVEELSETLKGKKKRAKKKDILSEDSKESEGEE